MDRSPFNVGILLFNQVELLDFSGPYEVFCMAKVPPSCLRMYRGVIAWKSRIVSRATGHHALGSIGRSGKTLSR